MSKKNKHFEWSKILTVLVVMPYLIVIFLSIYIALKCLYMGESSNCVDIVQAILAFVSAPLAVAYGFYFWKSKAENLVKCAKELKKSGISEDVAGSILDSSNN